MTFVDLQFTPEEFEALQKAYSGVLANQEKSPEYQFGKVVSQALFESPFRQALSAAAINGASREQTIELAHAMTANAADYSFVFVGNIDLDTLRPLVETYIASLPSDPAKAVKEFPAYDPAMFSKNGTGIDTFTTPMSTPQTYVAIVEKGNAPGAYDAKNSMLASIAGQILTNRLLKTVREDMGAVYSIGASGFAQRNGTDPYQLGTQFPMKPEMKQEVLDFIYGQFKAMENDITADELNPAKEYMAKSYTEQKEQNNPWLNAITGWFINGVDTFNGNIDVLNTITVDDVKAYMKALNSDGDRRTVILEPAK